VVGPWLVEGAARLADTLRGAGPDAKLWTPVPGGSTKFYARRFAHETVIHRADATLAVGAEFTVEDIERLGMNIRDWVKQVGS
jgi:Mycothiol maleylpyruvate isomerase N-terminal domain